ncbi:MAG: deoxyribonuclease IV [Victivallaceae bacterium]|nr:deoxyribonuclease IV [Victivallaceae bacterium]
MKHFGAHVSAAGGLENAPLNAAAIGADAFAMFTKNQRQWSAPPISEETAAAFKANCKESGIGLAQILPHDTYLINLAQPDDAKRAAASEAFARELERCAALGLVLLNFHPGSSLGKISDGQAISNIAKCVRDALTQVPGVKAVFENTAGQGSVLGYSFAQLAEMLEKVGMPERTGVCIDTCHAFAAGYRLDTDDGYASAMDEFERRIGFKYLSAMHLNDAAGIPGGHLDRHASIGMGSLGKEAFRRIASDPRIDEIPLVLETPDPGLWATEIEMLRAWSR